MQGGLVRGGFIGGDFGAKLNAATEDTLKFGRETRSGVEIITGVRLTGVRCERASFLGIWRHTIGEVISEGDIRAEGRVVI